MKTHDLFVNEQQRFECRNCRRTWKNEPQYECPGVPVYQWGEWGELLTKKQLYDAGYQTGAKLPAPAGVCYREKSPDGKMWLYDAAQAVKRNPASEKQKGALAKAQHMAARVGLFCSVCRREIDYNATRKQAEGQQNAICEHCNDKWEATLKARKILKSCVILDTETTGLSTYYDEIVQIAVINQRGETLLDTLVKPTPEGIVRMYTKNGAKSAFDVHHISAEMLENAPTWEQIYPELRRVLSGQYLGIYNLNFDYPIISRLSQSFPKLELKGKICLMELYAAYVNEIRWSKGDGWNEWNWSYRWQSLWGKHTALSDCQAALEALREMAADTTFEGDAGTISTPINFGS